MGKVETQESQRRSSSPSLRPKKSWCFILSLKAEKSWAPVQRESGRRNSLLCVWGEGSHPFCSSQAFSSLDETQSLLGRVICFTQFINSDIELIWKHPHRHIQNNVWPNFWVLCGPVRLTPYQVNHHNFIILRHLTCGARSSDSVAECNSFSVKRWAHCFGRFAALCRSTPLPMYFTLVII